MSLRADRFFDLIVWVLAVFMVVFLMLIACIIYSAFANPSVLPMLIGFDGAVLGSISGHTALLGKKLPLLLSSV
jgi:hypothetical protein